MVTLTNVGANYDTIAAAKGLGLQAIDFSGVTSVLFHVYVNKIGTGAQSWQLWNVTDGSEIALITDAGVAGDKLLSTQVSVALSGVKVVRVRAKSTVAADDPVYYAASILLVRP